MYLRSGDSFAHLAQTIKIENFLDLYIYLKPPWNSHNFKTKYDQLILILPSFLACITTYFYFNNIYYNILLKQKQNCKKKMVSDKTEIYRVFFAQIKTYKNKSRYLWTPKSQVHLFGSADKLKFTLLLFNSFLQGPGDIRIHNIYYVYIIVLTCSG